MKSPIETIGSRTDQSRTFLSAHPIRLCSLSARAVVMTVQSTVKVSIALNNDFVFLRD